MIPDPASTRAVVSRAVVTLCCSSLLLSGCATSSKDVATTYVSPLQYQSYDCAQLQSESLRIQTRVTELGGRLDQAASNDKAIMGVGMILFWPALFALGGTKQQEAEFARLKGEYDALNQSAIQKKCEGLVATAAKPDAAASAPREVPAAVPPAAATASAVRS